MLKFEKYDFPKLGLVRLPEIKLGKTELESVPREFISNYQFLRDITFNGLENRIKTGFISNEKKQSYVDQLEFELKLIEELSFTDYFLLVWRVINKAKELNAFIDYGRGSCAGSLIFYCLNVTGVDPLDKGLFFARFISKVRAKKQIIDGITYLDGDLAPDVDLNVSVWRQDIVNWLESFYPGRMSKIATLSSLSGKILVKDVYKTFLKATEEQAKDLADLIEKHHGIVEDIEKMPEKNADFNKWTKDNAECFSICLKLRDLWRGKSSHASGYLISYDLLNDTVPLELNKEKELVCGYQMSDSAKISIKLDLLGLTSNKIIKEVLDEISEKIEDIDKKLDNDPFIYDVLQEDFLPYGLYQISADTAYRVTKKIKPKNIYELSDVNCIARPGALDYLNGYVENNTPCPHPVFEKILSKTRNYCLTQEQMMAMAIAIGFSPEDSELLRRVVGKKKVDEVKLWKDRIYENCQRNGFGKEVGDILWKILDDSSKYSFNLSHSLSTSYLSALTVYLKYKYPVQFFTACLNNAKELPNPIDEIKEIKKELYDFDITLAPPDITKSNIDKFSHEGNKIIFPLSNIKGISDKAIEKLKKFKLNTANKFQIFNAAKEAKLSISIFGSLILSGCLDNYLTESRIKTLAEACLWNLLTAREQNFAIQYGEQYNFNLIDTIKALNEIIVDEKGKPIIKSSRRDTLRKHFAPYNEIYKNNIKNAQLSYYFFEKKLLGFSHSTNLYELFKDSCELNKISEVKTGLNDEYYKVIGEVVECWEKTSKNDNKYLKVLIENMDGQIPCFLFNSKGKNGFVDKIALHEEDNGRRVKEGDIIIAKGRRKSDALFCDYLALQQITILERISQVEKEK